MACVTQCTAEGRVQSATFCRPPQICELRSIPMLQYTRLVSNSAPMWSSRCCFTACHF